MTSYISLPKIAVISEALRLGRHLSRTKPALGEQVLALARQAHVLGGTPEGIERALEAIRIGGGTIPQDPTVGMSAREKVQWHIHCSWNAPALDPIQGCLDFLLEEA